MNSNSHKLVSNENLKYILLTQNKQYCYLLILKNKSISDKGYSDFQCDILIENQMEKINQM